MLIGNRWVENTRLKILNTQVALGAAWVTFPGTIQTNLSECGFLTGLWNVGLDEVSSIWELQVLFDGQPQHTGTFRGLIQGFPTPVQEPPNRLLMPQLDIPANTEVTVRGRISVGANMTASYLDLYVVVYYVKDWEAALPAVCFPTDVAPPGQV